MNHDSLYAIIGFPLEHTASPCMHNALFKAYGIPAVYVPISFKREDLKSFFSSCRFLFKGLNVTVPYKKDVIPFLEEIDGHARSMQAVNVIKNKKGVLCGYNTDFIGLRHNIRNSFGFTLKNKTIAILGAGGAARSAVYLAANDGAKRIYLINRTLKKAAETASLFNGAPGIDIAQRHSREAREYISLSQVIINTTSLGLRIKDAMPMKKEWLKKSHYVLDMIYNPKETLFLRQARKSGCRTANGLDMLIYQGAESFRIWTGKKPDVKIMKKAALKVIY